MKLDKILLSHGSGGKLSHDLISNEFLSQFNNELLEKLDDSAVLNLGGRIAFTTDSYVVSPIFFPGGDIGRLAVCGTVNDLAMSGAVPLYLSLSLILEEGLPKADLSKIINSIKNSAEEAGVKIVTGDTKVVDRGSVDKIFVNTSGIGIIPNGVNISGLNAQPGDVLILSGSIGEHGITILSQREGLNFSSPLKSDCAPLNSLVTDMLEVCSEIHCMRDPTRGGLATTLNEFASQSKIGIAIEEKSILVKPAVQAICELLGIDPLYIANEGKLVGVVPQDKADRLIQRMKGNKYGKDASIIGRVITEHPGTVIMKTGLGTSRIIRMLTGDLLPRIC
ncbi:MAG: hydrogenase expression/formation protein HypE [Dehalococcoidia bacterium]|nr:MAG: hydrogenase expression/formation protein HypE [Dehalococcoidia bacterium]